MRTPFLLLATLALAACATDPAPDAPAPGDAPGEIVAEAPDEGVISAPAAPFDVNTATREQLATIPGVGERMMHEFEEYRPYRSILQFRREIGKYVDDAQVAAYEAYLFVPIDPKGSDAETLMQLPDTDAAAAAALLAGQPYADKAAFLEAWAAQTGGDPARGSVYVQAP